MLTAQDLEITFRRYDGLFRQVAQPRLSGISFTLKPGQVTAVIGGSGAGKSLLAHAILGLLPANATASGGLCFDGQSLIGCYPKGLRGRVISLMPQSLSHLDPTATAGAQLGWARARRNEAADAGAIADAFAALDLPQGALKLYPHQLSGGMARRLLFGIATAGLPKLLIADEPTAGLDPDLRDAILARLRAQADEGCAVLLISHDLSAIIPFAEEVLLLKDGQMQGLELAQNFVADGAGLQSDYAKQLWRALPQIAQPYACAPYEGRSYA